MNRSTGAALVSGAALLLLTGGARVHAVAAQAAPGIKIMSPAAGQQVTDNDVKVTTAVSNFKVQCAGVGLPDKAGEGHIHAMLDGMTMAVLTNFYCDPNFTIAGDGLKPGKHQLIVVLAGNTHGDVGEPASVDFDYQPAQVRPLPAAANGAAKPSVTIGAPADNAPVGPKFDLKLQTQNFNASCALEGKGNVVGYGHYHVFVDMDMAGMAPGGMMSMAGMIAMPCSDTVPVDLSVWANGQHTLTVMLVNNDHTPIAGPAPAMIMVNLQGSSGAGRPAAPPAAANATGQTVVTALPATGSGGNLDRSQSHQTVVLLTGIVGVLLAVGAAGAVLGRRLRS